MKIPKKRILFCSEKWCDGTPNLGLTNNFHNLFNTFSHFSQGKYNWNTLHIDECSVVYNNHLDNILPQYCVKWDVHVVIYSLLGDSPMNPSINTFKKLKALGVYQCFTWPDTGPGWGTQTIDSLGDIPDLHVSWDNPCSPYHENWPKRDNHLFLWVPQDESLYYPQEQDINASFIGSPRYYDRHLYLNAVKNQILVAGGQREQKLSPEEYAKLIRRSKIGINFSASPAMFWQTKGRIFEILASKSMLLEQENPATAKLFIKDKEYITFNSPQELVEKVDYYTYNEEERNKIAEAGYAAFRLKYTSQLYWEKIFEKINE